MRYVDFLLKFGDLDQTDSKCSCESYVGMCFLSPSLGGEGINRFLYVSRLHQHLHWHDTHLCARFLLTYFYQTNMCIYDLELIEFV